MIAALLVTHNSERYLPDLLVSIDQQTRQPDLRIAIDDHSTDNTTQVLRDHGFHAVTSRSTATDTTTRIAQNFVQGVTAARDGGAGIVILGDHDDMWHPHRIAHQADFLTNNPHIAMLASDGNIRTGDTLRSTFPVPVNFNAMTQNEQWRYAAKHSIATGGASGLNPHNLSTLEVPQGWLHDRWWSLRAVREGAMAIDSVVVIDYRLSPDQQVGLDTAGQHNPLAWITNKIKHAPHTVHKMRDIAQLLKET